MLESFENGNKICIKNHFNLRIISIAKNYCYKKATLSVLIHLANLNAKEMNKEA